MNKIYKKNAIAIAAGASIFSTGGGFEYNSQLSRIEDIFSDDEYIKLMQLEELDETDAICTAYGVGSASDTDVDLGRAFRLAFEKIEQITGRKHTGIFAGETNIEALVFEIAMQTGLPVIDADCTGGRAVPEIQFDNMFLHKQNIVPVVAANTQGEILVIEEDKKADEIEKQIRDFAVSTGSSIGVLDHSMSVRDAKRYLTSKIFTRSNMYGEIILNSKLLASERINKILSLSGGKTLFDGVVSKLNLRDQNAFLVGDITFSNEEGDSAKILVKNENIVLEINDNVSLTAPDLITVLDKTSAFGVHNSKIEKGQEVMLVGIKATDDWRSTNGVEIFNPEKAGFNKPIKLLS